MEAYKVCFAFEGKTYSCITFNMFCGVRTAGDAVLEYEIGRVTRPNFGFIFCFDNEENARRFMRINCFPTTCVLYRGIGVPASRKEHVAYTNYFASAEHMKERWLRYASMRYYDVVPNGTVFMRTFRPIEVVKQIQ